MELGEEMSEGDIIPGRSRCRCPSPKRYPRRSRRRGNDLLPHSPRHSEGNPRPSCDTAQAGARADEAFVRLRLELPDNFWADPAVTVAVPPAEITVAVESEEELFEESEEVEV